MGEELIRLLTNIKLNLAVKLNLRDLMSNTLSKMEIIQPHHYHNDSDPARLHQITGVIFVHVCGVSF